MNLQTMMRKAQASPFSLWTLNHILWRKIPFNRPHRFKILKLSETTVETFAPYLHRNLNHIKGIHACALATIAEYSAGLLLLTHVDGKKYRLILSELKVDYHYQAKKNTIARCELTELDRQQMFAELEKDHKIQKTLRTEIYDQDQNHLASVDTTWQLKSWNAVNTKL